METIQRAKRIGGSLMIRIPKDIVELEGISSGMSIQADIKRARKSWFGAFPWLKPLKKEEYRFRSKYE
ncbi:MAG: hypothetical protein Q7K43_02415 [Candidatus Woesearchaeota archaeon]|nr:hypothetical protein [Candidatus Woesearchaeota archaeon]